MVAARPCARPSRSFWRRHGQLPDQVNHAAEPAEALVVCHHEQVMLKRLRCARRTACVLWHGCSRGPVPRLKCSRRRIHGQGSPTCSSPGRRARRVQVLPRLPASWRPRACTGCAAAAQCVTIHLDAPPTVRGGRGFQSVPQPVSDPRARLSQPAARHSLRSREIAISLGPNAG